jgi:hypothetical protein
LAAELDPIPLELELNSAIDFEIAWEFNLAFGFTEKNGFYIMAGQGNGLLFRATVETANGATGRAKIGFLELAVAEVDVSMQHLNIDKTLEPPPLVGAEVKLELWLNPPIDTTLGGRLFSSGVMKAKRSEAPSTSTRTASTSNTPPKPKLFGYGLKFELRLFARVEVASDLEAAPALIINALDVGFTKEFSSESPPNAKSTSNAKTTRPARFHLRVLGAQIDMGKLIPNFLTPALSEFCQTVGPVYEPLSFLNDPIAPLTSIRGEPTDILDVLLEVASTGAFGAYKVPIENIIRVLNFLESIVGEDGLCKLVDPRFVNTENFKIPPTTTTASAWSFAYLRAPDDLDNFAFDPAPVGTCSNLEANKQRCFARGRTTNGVPSTKPGFFDVYISESSKPTYINHPACRCLFGASQDGGVRGGVLFKLEGAGSDKTARNADSMAGLDKASNPPLVGAPRPPKKGSIFQRLTDASSNEASGGLLLDILTPKAALDMVLGKTTTLFTLWAPLLTTGKISIEFILLTFYGVLDIGVLIELELTVNLGIGFDTYGINKFINSGDPLQILDGAFICLYDRVTKEKKPIMSVSVSFGVFGRINAVFAKATAWGAIKATATLTLAEVDGDLKLRPSEIYTLVTLAPDPGLAFLNLFEATITIGFEMGFKVEIGVPFFGYSTVYSTIFTTTLYAWSSPKPKMIEAGSTNANNNVLEIGGPELDKVARKGNSKKRRQRSVNYDCAVLSLYGGGGAAARETIDLTLGNPSTRDRYSQTFESVSKLDFDLPKLSSCIDVVVRKVQSPITLRGEMDRIELSIADSPSGGAAVLRRSISEVNMFCFAGFGISGEGLCFDQPDSDRHLHVVIQGSKYDDEIVVEGLCESVTVSLDLGEGSDTVILRGSGDNHPVNRIKGILIIDFGRQLPGSQDRSEVDQLVVDGSAFFGDMHLTLDINGAFSTGNPNGEVRAEKYNYLSILSGPGNDNLVLRGVSELVTHINVQAGTGQDDVLFAVDLATRASRLAFNGRSPTIESIIIEGHPQGVVKSKADDDTLKFVEEQRKEANWVSVQILPDRVVYNSTELNMAGTFATVFGFDKIELDQHALGSHTKTDVVASSSMRTRIVGGAGEEIVKLLRAGSHVFVDGGDGWNRVSLNLQTRQTATIEVKGGRGRDWLEVVRLERPATMLQINLGDAPPKCNGKTCNYLLLAGSKAGCDSMVMPTQNVTGHLLLGALIRFEASHDTNVVDLCLEPNDSMVFTIANQGLPATSAAIKKLKVYTPGVEENGAPFNIKNTGEAPDAVLLMRDNGFALFGCNATTKADCRGDHIVGSLQVLGSSFADLEIDLGDGNDSVFVDGTSKFTTSVTIHLGNGSDRFQVGQLFESGDWIPVDKASIGHVSVEMTTDGYLSRGNNQGLIVHGGEGPDSFLVLSNKGTLTLRGDAGDDLFEVVSFVIQDENFLDCGSVEETTIVETGSGEDRVSYTLVRLLTLQSLRRYARAVVMFADAR